MTQYSTTADLEGEVRKLGAPRSRPQLDLELHPPVEGPLAPLGAPVRVRYLRDNSSIRVQCPLQHHKQKHHCTMLYTTYSKCGQAEQKTPLSGDEIDAIR